MAVMDCGAAGPTNLGNPHEISVLEIAQLILEITGSRSSIAFKGLPVDDPKRRCPDISIARNRLIWRPRVELTDGLKLTIDYFRRLLDLGQPTRLGLVG